MNTRKGVASTGRRPIISVSIKDTSTKVADTVIYGRLHAGTYPC